MKLRRPAAEALRILVPEVAAREMGAGSRTGLAVGVNCNELVVGVNGDELAGVEVGTDIPWGVEVGTHILWGVVVIYRLVEVVVKETVAASDGSAVAARVRVEGVNIQHMEAEVVVEALYKVVATAVEENGQVVVVMVTEEVGKDEDRMAEEVNVEVVVVSGAEVVVNGVEEAAVEANYSSKEWVRAAAGVSILELAAEASLAVEEVVVWDSKLAEGVMVKEAEATAEVEASKRVAEVTAAVEKAVGCGWQAFVAYINVGCYYVVGIPLGLLLGFYFRLGAKGIWGGMLAGTIMQTLILMWITFRTDWNKEVEEAMKRLDEWQDNKEPLLKE